MFTGLIESIGLVKRVDRRTQDLTLTLSVNAEFLEGVQLGASISVNGVCLTVVTCTESELSFDVSGETLSCTTLHEVCEGLHVNLERCLTLAKPLGGHILTGHVHGVGVIHSLRQDGKSQIYEIDVPRELMKYMAAKGSVALDGISLTVNAIRQSSILVNIIPHTILHTHLQFKRKGDKLNIEVDILSVYIERLIAFEVSEELSISDPDLLKRLIFSKTEH